MQIRSVFWEIEEAILQICFLKLNLSLIVTPRSLRELETSRSSSNKLNCGWGVPNQLRVIECILRGSSFILHVKNHNWILNKSLFNELATFIQSEGDAISAYKVVSPAYRIVLFLILFHISTVYRIKINGPKTVP